MKDVLQIIEQYKLVPVVTVQRIEEAANMFGALCRGGLPVAEICFRTGCAEKAIKLAAKKYPAMLVGAGTVINKEQCVRAIEAGAKFIVSPGFSEEAAKACRERGTPYFPGAVTPTEILEALALGFTYLKFFPAGCFGGLKTIQALSAAFPHVRFMPTGGVNLDNMGKYLACPAVFACGGSWMMKGTAEEIEQKTRAAVAAAKGE